MNEVMFKSFSLNNLNNETDAKNKVIRDFKNK